MIYSLQTLPYLQLQNPVKNFKIQELLKKN